MRKLRGFLHTFVAVIVLALFTSTASADPFTPPRPPDPPKPHEPIVIDTVQPLSWEMLCEIFQGASTGYCGGDPVNRSDPMGLYITIGNSPKQYRSVDDFPLNVQQAIDEKYTYLERMQLEQYLEDDVEGGHPFATFAKMHNRFTGGIDATASIDLSVIGSAAASQASEMVEGTKVIFQGDAGVAYEEIINQQAKAAAVVWREDGGLTATSYVLGNYTGATPFLEGTYGNDLSSKRKLDSTERWSRGLQGGGGLVLSFTAASAATSSLRAGYTGTGFGNAYRWATTFKGSGLTDAKAWLTTYNGSGFGPAYFGASSAAGANVDLGKGDIMSHFTNAEGVSGITGISPGVLSELKPGQTLVVNSATFKPGVNAFLTGEGGGVGVTKLPVSATPGELNSIGVFGDKQQYGIQFSQESALNSGAKVSPVIPDRSIFSVPGNSTIKGNLIITKRY